MNFEIVFQLLALFFYFGCRAAGDRAVGGSKWESLILLDDGWIWLRFNERSNAVSFDGLKGPPRR